MNIHIKIHCDDERELLLHLSKIRKTIKKAFADKTTDDPSEIGFRANDANCYGEHEIMITPDIDKMVDVLKKIAPPSKLHDIKIGFIK